MLRKLTVLPLNSTFFFILQSRSRQDERAQKRSAQVLKCLSLRCQVAQSIEHLTLEVEVQGSKPALGTGGGVGSHLISPIRRDFRSLDDTDNRQLTTASSALPNLGNGKIGRFAYIPKQNKTKLNQKFSVYAQTQSQSDHRKCCGLCLRTSESKGFAL